MCTLPSSGAPGGAQSPDSIAVIRASPLRNESDLFAQRSEPTPGRLAVVGWFGLQTIRQTTSEPRFASIKDACRRTGLSQCFLRSGCKDGSVPCVKAGNKYMIDLVAFSRRLDELSENRGAGA